MRRFCCVVLTFFFFLSCCVMAQAKNGASATVEYDEDNPRPAIIHEPRRLPHFSNVDVSDDLEVILTGGHAKQSVVLVGDSRAVEEVATEVRNKTLYIERMDASKSSEDYNQKVLVKIGMTGNLSELTVSDHARVKAYHIKSHGLTINLQDHGKLIMEGRGVPVRKIQNDSTQNLALSGISTRHLNVRGAGTGRIILGGSAGILTAYLYDAACLEAGNLRAREIYIHTEEQALGIVRPIEALYAFAIDSSNIYYYQTPSGQLVRYSADRGNVLKVP